MATFTGTANNDTITPTLISVGVVANPPGSFPTAAADTIDGAAGSDTLDGGDGNDSVLGGPGTDLVNGGFGDDTIAAGAGDTADGDGGNDLFLVGSAGAGTTLAGDLGTDTFEAQGALDISAAGVTGFEILSLDSSPLTMTALQLVQFNTIVADGGATTGSLVISGGSNSAVTDVTQLQTLNVTGAAAADNLTFTTSGATVTDISVGSGDGNGRISTGSGDDTLSLGNGNDTGTGNAGDDEISGGAGTDSLSGGVGDDTLRGGDTSVDTLSGGDGGDSLAGNGGADVVNGRAGDDTVSVLSGGGFDGDDGNDLFVVSSAAAGTTINGDLGTDTFDAQGVVALNLATTVTGIERLALDASILTLSAAQLESFTTIVSDSGAVAGSITLSAGGSATTQVSELATLNVVGSGAADLLTFTTTGAVVTAIGAALGLGADVLSGGGGADTVLGEGGNDTVLGNNGADSLDGGAASDSLAGGLGLDTLAGNAGNDTLVAGDGADNLNGGAGSDLMQGGNGNDLYFVDVATDVVDETGGSGLDRVSSTISFTLGAGIENLTLTGAANLTGTGSAVANTILGNAGANVLTGLDGNDSLGGGGGADTLIGGNGADTLAGAAGADVFLVFSPAEGVDQINGFVAADEIQLDDAGFAGLALGAMNASNFIAKAGAAATNPAGVAQVIYDTNTGDLWFDADGSGAGLGVNFARLNAIPALAAADLVVI